MSARDLPFWVEEIGSILAIATGFGVAIWQLHLNTRGRSKPTRETIAQSSSELADKLDHLVRWLAWYGSDWSEAEQARALAKSYVVNACAEIRATRAPESLPGNLQAAWLFAQQSADQAWKQVEALHVQIDLGVQALESQTQAIVMTRRQLQKSASVFRHEATAPPPAT